MYTGDAGMRIPAGIKSPSGDENGEEVLPTSLHGNGDGGNLPPRGRGWGSNPDGEFPVDISRQWGVLFVEREKGRARLMSL